MPREIDIRLATDEDIAEILAELSNDDLTSALMSSTTTPHLFKAFVRKQFGRQADVASIQALLAKEADARVDAMYEAEVPDPIDWAIQEFDGWDAPLEQQYMEWRNLFGESYLFMFSDPPTLQSAELPRSFRPHVTKVLRSFYGRDAKSFLILVAGLFVLSNGQLLFLSRSPTGRLMFVANDIQELLLNPLPEDVVNAWGLRDGRVQLGLIGEMLKNPKRRKSRR